MKKKKVAQTPWESYITYTDVESKTHAEAIMQFEHVSNEMNLAKKNQWQIVFYGFALNFAIITAIANLELASAALFAYLSWVSVGVQIWILCINRKTISTSRAVLWEVEKYFSIAWTNQLLKKAGHKEYNLVDRASRDKLYAFLLCMLSVFVSGATTIAVFIMT